MEKLATNDTGCALGCLISIRPREELEALRASANPLCNSG